MSDTNGIILVVTGPISVISSVIIICMILRSRAKLLISYHRIMFGMSVTDIIFTSALSFSSLPAPADTPNIWKAIGNRSTCNAQGFCIMFGQIAAPTYFLSLQIYYFCVINCQSRRQTLKQNVEPCLHIAPILVGLIAAFVPLVTDSMNPGSRGYCWAQDYPLHCIDEEENGCIRGETARIQRFWLFIFPLIGNNILVVVLMWRIYVAVWEQDCRNASHTFRSSITQSPSNDGAQLQVQMMSGIRRRSSSFRSPEEIRAAQYRRSRKARQRILQYTVGYFLTFLFIFIDWILHNEESVDNLLEILTMIFYPLGGFYNLIVFVLPAVRRIQKRNTDLCLCRAIASAIISYIGPDNGNSRAVREIQRASIPTSPTQSHKNSPNTEDCHTNDGSIDRNESISA